MHRLNALSLFSLTLTVLLGVAGGTCQTATAQQPALDADQPLESLKAAVSPASPDSQLAALATALQKARADTEISFHEYQEGVHFFKQNHSGFYGNFFGDPFYATYDIRYQRLARERQLAETDINPQNSFRNNTWFFCWPSSYDPAFGGDCRGLRYMTADFWQLPSGLAFASLHLDPRLERRLQARTQRVRERQRRLPDAAPGESDTLGRPAPDAPESARSDADRLASNTTQRADWINAEERPRKPVPSEEENSDEDTPDVEAKPVSIEDDITIPEDVPSRMQKRAAHLRRQAINARLRYEIEQRADSDNGLSPRERSRLADRLGTTVYSADGRATESTSDLDLQTQYERGQTREFENSQADRAISFQDNEFDHPDRSEDHSTQEDFDDDNTSDSDFSSSDTPDRPRTSSGEHSINRSDVENESDEQKY